MSKVREPLIYSAAHLRQIFSRLLLAEKLDVHPVHLEFFAIAGKKICTESVPPHSISVSLENNNQSDKTINRGNCKINCNPQIILRQIAKENLRVWASEVS